MTPEQLAEHRPDLWERAVSAPFLTAVRDGSLPPEAFARWLAQDALFVADLLRFQARLLARAPRPAQAVLAAGCVALVEELDWFARVADERGLDLDAPQLPATVAYGDLLYRLDAPDVGGALAALWAIELTYLDAWSAARPGAGPYREFVEHWTLPGFASYVAGLETAADAAAADEAGTGDDGVFLEVVAAEAAFWQTAVDA